jgi:hypothetical protein
MIKNPISHVLVIMVPVRLALEHHQPESLPRYMKEVIVCPSGIPLHPAHKLNCPYLTRSMLLLGIPN